MIYEFLSFRRAAVPLFIDRAANDRSQSSLSSRGLAFHPPGKQVPVGSPSRNIHPEIHLARV